MPKRKPYTCLRKQQSTATLPDLFAQQPPNVVPVIDAAPSPDPSTPILVEDTADDDEGTHSDVDDVDAMLVSSILVPTYLQTDFTELEDDDDFADIQVFSHSQAPVDFVNVIE